MTREAELDHFDPKVRRQALSTLAALPAPAATSPANPVINLHFHTCFSYHTLGWSPSSVAWRAHKAGLAIAGIVDFDVLDGLDEFTEAGRSLGLKTCAGIETRVFYAELRDLEINSPGEPGIAYHLGLGLSSSSVPAEWQGFLTSLRTRAAARTCELVARVNAYLAPVELEYQRDVLPLTPKGNATERHVCLAYARKAQELFGDGSALAHYWAERLACEPDALDFPEGPILQQLIRAKTMKRGGAGYVQPDAGDFPRLEEMNAFVLACGGLPTYAWLDGTSEGEANLARLLELGQQTGVAAINLIPARNYTPGKQDRKLDNLRAVIAFAEEKGLPIAVGTEMNSPGQPFVDDFACAELAPFAPTFVKGAYIFYAHTVLEQRRGLGYLSPWARAVFTDVHAKNNFFAEVGRRFQPGCEEAFNALPSEPAPKDMLTLLPD